MKKINLHKITAVLAVVMLVAGCVPAQAYYLHADITGNEILTTGSFEGLDEISQDEFGTINTEGYFVVNAADEGLPGSSAHGKVVKRIANSGATHQFRTINKLVGTVGNPPSGDALEAAKKVVIKADIMVGAELSTGYFDLRAMMVEKKPDDGSMAESAEGNMVRIQYGNTAPVGGEAQGNALEVMVWNGNADKARVKTLNTREWYTFTAAFDVSGDDATMFKKSIWINDELVAEDWLPYQSSSAVRDNKIIQFINGLRISSTNVDADIYIDNIQLWTDGAVHFFQEYDGYDIRNVSMTKSDNICTVDFDIVSYMDACRPVVAMAAVYNKNTNTVGKVFYKPVEFVMGESVCDSIGNIELPVDYNEEDYEVRLYFWNGGSPFAPIIASISQS